MSLDLDATYVGDLNKYVLLGCCIQWRSITYVEVILLNNEGSEDKVNKQERCDEVLLCSWRKHIFSILLSVI